MGAQCRCKQELPSTSGCRSKVKGCRAPLDGQPRATVPTLNTAMRVTLVLPERPASTLHARLRNSPIPTSA